VYSVENLAYIYKMRDEILEGLVNLPYIVKYLVRPIRRNLLSLLIE